MFYKTVKFEIGDKVLPSGKYPKLAEDFEDGPKEVMAMDQGPAYAGGYFVYCDEVPTESDFCYESGGRYFKRAYYSNGLKKV